VRVARLGTRRLTLRFAVAITIALALVLVAAPSALAQPGNDDFANAAVAPSLPFSASADISQATIEPGEPGPCGVQQSVWYAITPSTNAVLQADTNGSSFSDTVLNVYRQDGSGLSGLSWRDCRMFGGSLSFGVDAGQTYYIQAGSYFGSGGNLHLHLAAYPPPANDDFANATAISALPFVDSRSVDLTGATIEPGEPGASCISPAAEKTVWYGFTPTQSGPITASLPTRSNYFGMAAYTGSSLGTLTEVGCDSYDGVLTFQATANTTYYFQVGGPDGQSGALQFQLVKTPPPTAEFYFYPTEPSIFDGVQFINYSSDPGGEDITTFLWDFGDGATATVACCPIHRYAADGDYNVRITVTTADGRIGSTSKVVQVRTHDVATVRIAVPNSAHVGQTIGITADVRNTRYPEMVQVALYRSVPGGFEQVGSLTQSVAVRSGGRTTPFPFAYTATQADRSVGKVSFRAVATIMDHRDALPADNELISAPVKVT
jgi:PKD repeat protein